MVAKNTAIIGARRAGLLPAISLLKTNNTKYSAAIFVDKFAEEFEFALQFERLLSLNFWDRQYPKNTSVNFTLVNPITPEKMITFREKPANPINQLTNESNFPAGCMNLSI